jgi:hypothetical protein
MKQSTLMVVLTSIIILIASFGKYVEGSITNSATTILEDRLKPTPLLSHIFDYYGSSVQDNLSETTSNIKSLQSHKDEILKSKVERDSMWAKYKKTYLVEEEARMVAKVDLEMADLDYQINEILTSPDTNRVKQIIKSKEFNTKINTALNDINWLLDLQTVIGQEETIKMMSLLNNFSNFMIGSLALALIMLGSIMYPLIKKQKPQKTTRTTRTSRVTKTTRTTKKPVVKKPIVRKPAPKTPIKKPVRR